MAHKEMEPVAADALKMAPAVTALQQYTQRYGLTLTADASRQVIDKALERKTESGVRGSVRTQLFEMLTKTDPAKAIEIEVKRYERRGFDISDKTKSQAMLKTGKIFESEEQARQAYLSAHALVRKEVTAQAVQKEPAAQAKAAEAPKAPAEVAKAPAAQEKPAAPTQENAPQISSTQQKAVAEKFEQMASERLTEIYAQNFNQKTIVNYCKAMPCSDSQKLEILDGAMDLIKKNTANPDNIGYIYISALRNGNATPEMKVAMDLQQAVLAGCGDIKLTTDTLLSFGKTLKPEADMVAQTRAALQQKGIEV